jgi:signal peptidase I
MTLARDIASSAVAAIIVALLLRLFVVGAYRIPSHSMESTLLVGDQIAVSKIAFLFRDVERGDVVVFALPEHVPTDRPGEPLIKRVVAVGGDTLRMSSTALYVNGQRQPAPPLSAAHGPLRLSADGSIDTVIVPDGHVYVIGDNRANSYDSRSWGALPVSSIQGTPLFVYWSYGADASDTTDHVRIGRMFTMVR